MKNLNKTITILGRKTDIILLVSACFLSMLITLNTMCSCVDVNLILITNVIKKM